MCGRFTLTSSIDTLLEYFGITQPVGLTPRYNIAPSQNVLVVRQNDKNSRSFDYMRWGLIPSWLKEEDISSQWINARAETAAIKPLFKHAFKQRRCLIAADGFYEWERTASKTPYYIHKVDGKPFGIAGLWEQWHNTTSNKLIESCTLLTTEANELLKPIHNRMPVILDASNFEYWLNPSNHDTDRLQKLLAPYTGNNFESYPITTYVNNPRHETIQCINRIMDSRD
jgi:putative SOS response-associated peptidase YedK